MTGPIVNGWTPSGKKGDISYLYLQKELKFSYQASLVSDVSFISMSSPPPRMKHWCVSLTLCGVVVVVNDSTLYHNNCYIHAAYLKLSIHLVQMPFTPNNSKYMCSFNFFTSIVILNVVILLDFGNEKDCCEWGCHISILFALTSL